MRYLGALILINLLSGCAKEEPIQIDEDTVRDPQQLFEWKLVTSWPKNFPGLGTAPENFARLELWMLVSLWRHIF